MKWGKENRLIARKQQTEGTAEPLQWKSILQLSIQVNRSTRHFSFLRKPLGGDDKENRVGPRERSPPHPSSSLLIPPHYCGPAGAASCKLKPAEILSTVTSRQTHVETGEGNKLKGVNKWWKIKVWGLSEWLNQNVLVNLRLCCLEARMAYINTYKITSVFMVCAETGIVFRISLYVFIDVSKGKPDVTFCFSQ